MFTQDDCKSSIAKVLSVLMLAEEVSVDALPVKKALVTALNAWFPRSVNIILEDLL